MKELEIIVADLRKCLDSKEAEINASTETVSAHIMSALDNKKLEVALFEKSTRDATSDPFEKNKVIINFTKGAEELKSEINKIGI